MSRCLGSGLCSAALLFACAAGAAAQAPDALPLELSWRAPEACPAAADVHAELARIATAAPGEDLRPLRADVAIARRGTVLTAELRTEHEGLTGERTLHASDCATLTRSVTLVLALAFGRGVTLREAQAAAREEPTPGASASASANAGMNEPAPAASGTQAANGGRQAEFVPSTAPQPDPQADEPAATERTHDHASERASPRFGVQLGGGAQLTLMPSIAPALHAGAALDLRAVSLELRATLMPATTQALTRDGEARFDALAGTALACARAPLLAACGGARIGAVRARGRGLTRDGEAVAPWYALALAARVHWPEHGAVQLGLEGLLALSLDRPRFEVTGLGRAHRAPLAAPELSAFVRLWP